MNVTKFREDILTQSHLFTHRADVLSDDDIDFFSAVAIRDYDT